MGLLPKRFSVLDLTVPMVLAALLTGCIHKKYENPITKDTQQPDKVLFDKSINDIEHGRYEVARLTLNTMINTYDTSEFLAKAKLAVADSWYREGGAHGLAQAEAEYKDFILFYPQMEESAESQWKVCQIHYRQMEKPDRDPTQAQRAEDECRTVLTQFPNSKYVPQAKQMLRNIQEDLAEKEFLAGTYYHGRQAFPAASARLSYVVDQYPLFSQADEALWELADSYNRLGDRWEEKAAQAYTRIVKDYPLSVHADDAAAKLKAMKRPVPDADPQALARMKYEEEHKTKLTMRQRLITDPLKEVISHGPDTHLAAKSGDPSMETMRPPRPISVPAPAGGAPGTGGGEVTVQQSASTDIDTKPDARAGVGAAGTPATGAAVVTPATGSNVTADPAKPGPATGTTTTTAAQAPLPTNYQTLQTKQQKKANAKKKKPAKNATTPPATTVNADGTPASATAPAATSGTAATPAPATNGAAPKTDTPR
jgi:outer membrane protein assembly factor BamD